MTQKPLLVKNKGGRPELRYGQADHVRVVEPEIDRVASEYDSPIGRIRRLEGTGKYHRDWLRLLARGERYPGHPYDYSQLVKRTAAGVREFVRRLREQEAAELDAIDAQITEVLERLSALRSERAAVMARAWQRGNVVRLNEIESALADGKHHGLFNAAEAAAPGEEE